MADSFLRMVTGWAMRYSNSSPNSPAEALATMVLGATSLGDGGAAGVPQVCANCSQTAAAG